MGIGALSAVRRSPEKSSARNERREVKRTIAVIELGALKAEKRRKEEKKPLRGEVPFVKSGSF